MFGLDLIAAVGGLIVPPVFDFIKKKFIKGEQDTPEATISTLATTKPETLPAYVAGLVELTRAKIAEFNQDVIGTPSVWVIDLRAAIRPIATALAVGALICDGMAWLELNQGVRYTFEVLAGSWYGSKLTSHK